MTCVALQKWQLNPRSQSCPSRAFSLKFTKHCLLFFFCFFPYFDSSSLCCFFALNHLDIFFQPKWKRQEVPLLINHLVKWSYCWHVLSCLFPPACLNGSVHSRNEIEWVSSRTGLQKGGPFKDNFGFLFFQLWILVILPSFLSCYFYPCTFPVTFGCFFLIPTVLTFSPTFLAFFMSLPASGLVLLFCKAKRLGTKQKINLFAYLSVVASGISPYSSRMWSLESKHQN